MTDAPAPTWQETEKFVKALQTGWMPDIEKHIERFPDAVNAVARESSPLTWAVSSKKLEVVQFLVSKGAEIDAPAGYDKKTPLASAAWYGCLDIVKFLHGKGADIHTRDNAKLTPLMHAARYGHMDIINYLMEHGADVTARDHRNESAADIARGSGKFDTAKFLQPVIGRAEGGALADAFTGGAVEKIRIMSPAKLKPAGAKSAP